MVFLIEQCVQCGQVHRWGDHRPVVDYHFHWGDTKTEFVAKIRKGSERGAPHEWALLHRTVCARHCSRSPEAWMALWEKARESLDPKYAVPGSLNAPLPASVSIGDEVDGLERAYKRMVSTFYAVPIHQKKAQYQFSGLEVTR